jgi:CRISPR-associated protein Csd1
MLLRNAQNHLGRVRKDKRGLAISLEKEVGGIVDLLDDSFPRSLRIEAQGHFAIGYYHQTQTRFRRAEGQGTGAEIEEETDAQGEMA